MARRSPRLFARQGARVFGIDRDGAALERSADIVRREGHTIATRVCDATDERQVGRGRRGLCRGIRAGYPRQQRRPLRARRPSRAHAGRWHEQIATNLDSAYNCCHHVLPVMEAAGGGSIVSVSSVAGLRYIGKDQVGYASAKAGLMQMTATSAVIYADRGIRLNCVVPGLMDTPLVRRLADKYAAGEYDRFVAARRAQVPMGRMGDAWDVAHAALYLASDEARYVTGHSLVVDGGLTCRTP